MFKVQFCPPNEIAKLAVPVVVGVPDMVYTMFPFPFAKLPVCNVAVKPVTPVDETEVPDVYATPLPPVYPIVAVPLNATFTDGEADNVAALHNKLVTVGVTAAPEIYCVTGSTIALGLVTVLVP
jgi:hypothetical protein